MTCSKDGTLQLSDINVALRPMDKASGVGLSLSTEGGVASHYCSIDRSDRAIMSASGLSSEQQLGF